MAQRKKREMLLHFLSIGTDEIQIASCEYLSDADWGEIALESIKGNVPNLLYHLLKPSGAGICVPARVMQMLEEFYLHTALRNSRLYHELSGLLMALEKADIPVILLKGAALAELVYGNAALRKMNDVDLLVRKEDLRRTSTVLSELGYSVPREYVGRRKWIEEEKRHLPPYKKAEGNEEIGVEVHWSIEPQPKRFLLGMENELWDRARPERIANVETLILSPEDLLFHLCIHMSPHHRFGVDLRTVCDIPILIRHYRHELDWEQFVTTVTRHNMTKSIHLALALTQKMLGTTIPDHVMAKLRPESFKPELIALAEGRIFSDINAPTKMVETVLPGKLMGKIGTALRYLFPARSEIANRFSVDEHSIFIYLFYPAHILDYAKKIWPFLRRFIRRDQPFLADSELDRWILP